MSMDKKHCILVVDDQMHNVALLKAILSPLYDVKTAESGEVALEMVAKHNPDLILLDILMPGMSGFEVLDRLKNSDTMRNIPVIFITGLDNSQDEEKGLLLGAVDYITKPFHASIVRLRVKTHLKILEQMRTIERLGMIDALTDIPNRRSFDHQLAVEWGRARREASSLSMLMIDIDKFKHFNDHYGHAHGDKVLKVVAGVIAQSLKRPSDLAARWGGEEFSVLLTNTNLNGALAIAERIRSNVESTNISCTDGASTSVTISVGVSTEMPDTNSRLEDFIARSDKALYAAKEAGRNKVRPVLE